MKKKPKQDPQPRTVYRPAPGSRIVGSDEDAAVVGTMLNQLYLRRGRVTALDVLAEAQRPQSPLHRFFQWDDSAAAESWRLAQAGELIRSVRVVIEPPGSGQVIEARRAFVRIEEPAGSYFEPIFTALSNAQHRQQIVDRALKELQSWQERYKDLSELAALFEALERARAA